MPNPQDQQSILNLLAGAVPDVEAVDVELISTDKDFTYLAVICMKQDAGKVEEVLRTGGFSKPSSPVQKIPEEYKKDLEAEMMEQVKAMHDEHEHHHHHHHHHGHDADEVFISWGEETHKKFTKAEIERILKALEDADAYGIVLRAKGYVANAEGEKWIHFDYVPGEPDIRDGGAMVTGRICVIGSKLNEEAVAKLFGVEKQ